jgi:recombination protein RecT
VRELNLNQQRTNNLPQKQRFSVAITTDKYRALINNTLSDPKRAQSFVASITSAVAVNPALQDCDPASIIAGALLGESLGLSPSPQLGQYYLVPFEVKVKGADGKVAYVTDPKTNRKVALTEKKASFVPGYRGYIQLAIRSGYYLDIDVLEIREGEYFGRDKFTGKPKFEFIEDDELRESLPVIGYMAYFEYINGFKKVLYWSKEKMLQHADRYSAAFSAEDYKRLLNNEIPPEEMWKYSSYWYKDFDGMAKKTMLRQLISKWGVMSTEMNKAFESDSSFIKAENGDFIPEPAPDTLPEAEQPPEPEKPQEPQKIDLDNV